MNKDLIKALKDVNGKLIAVPEDIAEEIQRIADNMNESPTEVLRTALSLLKYSLGRGIRIKKANSNVEMDINLLENYKSITKFKGEDGK